MGLTQAASNITKSGNAIEIYKGQTKDIQVTVTQIGQDPTTGDYPANIPVDLTGATVYFTVKARPGDPVTLVYKVSTTSSQITIATPTTGGIATIHLLPLDTYKMAADTYVFDIWVVLSTGATYPVVEVAEFIIKEPVTVVNG